MRQGQGDRRRGMRESDREREREIWRERAERVRQGENQTKIL